MEIPGEELILLPKKYGLSLTKQHKRSLETLREHLQGDPCGGKQK